MVILVMAVLAVSLIMYNILYFLKSYSIRKVEYVQFLNCIWRLSNIILRYTFVRSYGTVIYKLLLFLNP